MRAPRSYTALEELGRVRLSRHFFMRDFLHSEIANFFARPNIPDDPDLAIAAGRALCTELLDPLVETFGPIHVRSAFRSSALNHFGATQVRPQKCARNEATVAGHIWDRRDARGRMGACACIVIPWFADQYARGRDWRDLAWWVHDHLPYHEMCFFPRLAAFNLTWREDREPSIRSYIAPRGTLLRAGAEPAEPPAGRAARHADFPAFRAIRYPDLPARWRAA
ncbi:MAG: hypothetical protein D6811_04820 [Alphaproteobacteria bacterium]|nr:MAG: hypothetical protein D6811_04820 [Alphaproteobacteria bacterium]